MRIDRHRVTSSGSAPIRPTATVDLAQTVDHVSRCAEISDHTRRRLRQAVEVLRAADHVRQERDTLRAEVERLKLQGGHSSRLPATVSPSAA